MSTFLDDAPLHALWTKAVGTAGYDKRQWLELEKKLHDGLVARQQINAGRAVSKQRQVVVTETGDWTVTEHNDGSWSITDSQGQEAGRFANPLMMAVHLAMFISLSLTLKERLDDLPPHD